MIPYHPVRIGMTAESILERISQKPFRPLALQTVGGTWIEVSRAEDIFIYDRINSTWVVLFDPAGRKFVYAPEQITAIEAREMERA
jgi:hypothetical protein